MPSKTSKKGKRGLTASVKNEINADSGKINACWLLQQMDDEKIQDLESQIEALQTQLNDAKKAKTLNDKTYNEIEQKSKIDYTGKVVMSTGLPFEKVSSLVGLGLFIAQNAPTLDKQISDFILELEHLGSEFLEKNKIRLEDAAKVNLDEFVKEHMNSSVSIALAEGKSVKKRKYAKKQKSDDIVESSASEDSSLNANTEDVVSLSAVEVSHDEGAVVNG